MHHIVPVTPPAALQHFDAEQQHIGRHQPRGTAREDFQALRPLLRLNARHDFADRTDHRHAGRLFQPRCGGKGRAQLPHRERRTDARAQPRDEDAGEQQHAVGRGRRARHRRRVDDREFHIVRPRRRLPAQRDLLALGQQLIVLILQHLIIAVDLPLFGGDRRVLRQFRGQLVEIALQLRLAHPQPATADCLSASIDCSD